MNWINASEDLPKGVKKLPDSKIYEYDIVNCKVNGEKAIGNFFTHNNILCFSYKTKTGSVTLTQSLFYTIEWLDEEAESDTFHDKIWEKDRLIEYIYEFGWNYGRFYHLEDGEKIKAAIKERLLLPEEFVAKIETDIPDMDGSFLVGKCRKRFDELEDKQFDWQSFYNGWIAGRTDLIPYIKKIKESFDNGEREVLIQAFDKVRQLFLCRNWIMEGRGCYPYNDDKYKEEVRYLFDEFDAVQKDVWENIKSKTFEYRHQIIQEWKDGKYNNNIVSFEDDFQSYADRILRDKGCSSKETYDAIADTIKYLSEFYKIIRVK